MRHARFYLVTNVGRVGGAAKRPAVHWHHMNCHEMLSISKFKNRVQVSRPIDDMDRK